MKKSLLRRNFSIPLITEKMNNSFPRSNYLIPLIIEKMIKSLVRKICYIRLITEKISKSLLRLNCSIPLITEKMGKSYPRRGRAGDGDPRRPEEAHAVLHDSRGRLPAEETVSGMFYFTTSGSAT